MVLSGSIIQPSLQLTGGGGGQVTSQYPVSQARLVSTIICQPSPTITNHHSETNINWWRNILTDMIWRDKTIHILSVLSLSSVNLWIPYKNILVIHHDIITSSSEYFHSILLKPSFVICAECGPARVYARVLSPVIIFYCVYTGEHCVDVDDRFWPIFQPRADLGSCQTSQPSKHLQAGVLVRWEETKVCWVIRGKLVSLTYLLSYQFITAIENNKIGIFCSEQFVHVFKLSSR